MQIKIPAQLKSVALYSMISIMIITALYSTFHLSRVEELGARIARDQYDYAKAADALNKAEQDAIDARAELNSLFTPSR